MPTYTYLCNACFHTFELFSSIRDYTEKPKCILCNSKKTQRHIVADAATISGSIKKSDNELKTIGDLANRNRDKLSNDQKEDLYIKHNSYKDEPPKELPKGMKRVKKGKGIKWT